MSECERGYGYVVPLVTPLSKEKRRQFMDAVDDNDDDHVRINYEGTLLYINYPKRLDYTKREKDFYHLTLGNYGKPQDLIDIANKYNLPIHEKQIIHWNSIHYNGVDHPLNQLRLSYFNEHFPENKKNYFE